MKDAPIPLTIAIADAPHVAALKAGRVAIAGAQPQFLSVAPQIAAFRRMVRELAFDVCELAPTTFLMARALGAPIVALPIFLMRRFHHGGLLVRPEAGVKAPKDLEGRRVGVRAYSVTTGVWTRSILMEDYGLENDRVTWVVDDEEHVREARLPRNVVHAPEGRSLIDMMERGEIDAGFAGNAGLGRAGAPGAGWDARAGEAHVWPELFPDAAQREREWHARTKIYPLHGLLAVKESVLKEKPALARAIFIAFEESKAEWLAKLHAGEACDASDLRYKALVDIVGPDPLPYGMQDNMPAILAMERAARNQGLIARRVEPAEAFIDPFAL